MMIRIDTKANKDPSEMNQLGRSASFSSPSVDSPKKHQLLERSASFSSPSSSKSDDSTGDSSPRPSPTKQASFSAIVNVSKMQASFAERTAMEMEEIVSWYKKFEGTDRLKKENQQIQFMPDNAMIVVDDDDEDDDDGFDTFEGENNGGNNATSGIDQQDDQQDDQQEKLQVGVEEYVLVKDYYTPSQKSKIVKPMISDKKPTPSLLSAVRSISKGGKCNDPPPRAIKIPLEDEDESVISALTTRHITDDSMKRVNQLSANDISGDLMRKNENLEEMVAYRDEEEEVLAMLSPVGCKKLKDQTLIETPNDYRDEEQEVLELLSPVSSRRNSVLSGNFNEGQSNDSVSCTSTTGEEAQSQIKAADDLIRNTQNMAEIILKLQQSSLLPGTDDSDDDDDIANIYGDNVNQEDDSLNPEDMSINASLTFNSAKVNVSPITTMSLTSIQYEKSLDMNSIDASYLDERRQADRTRRRARRLRSKMDTRSTLDVFQANLFYKCTVPILFSLIIGFILKLFINEE